MTFYQFNRHMSRFRNYHGCQTKENPYYHLFSETDPPVRPTLDKSIPSYSTSHLHLFFDKRPRRSDLYFKFPDRLQASIGQAYTKKFQQFIRSLVDARQEQGDYPRSHLFEFTELMIEKLPGHHSVNGVKCTMSEILYSRSLLRIFLSKQFPYISFPVNIPLNQFNVKPFNQMSEKACFPMNVTCIDGAFYFHISSLTIDNYASITTRSFEQLSSAFTPKLTL